ncbi:MAG TPA: hypothetical protein VF740_06245, partial [Candidatus Acidoferrum sp.]
RVVRRYSSTDKPELMEKIARENPIPMYWVRPMQILPAEPGAHRFVWDMHYAPPQALEHEFPISAIYHDTPRYPLGAWALPGNYTVKLTVDGMTYAQPLVVKMDARITTSLADLRKQFAMESGSVEGMNQSYEALAQVRSVRAQLQVLAARAGKGRLAEAIATLDKKAAELEGAAQSSFYGLPPRGKQSENFSTLNQHFAGTLAVAGSADAAPTSQATAAFGELRTALESLLSVWKNAKEQDLPALNKQLKEAGLPEVEANKTQPQGPSNEPDGDDQP